MPKKEAAFTLVELILVVVVVITLSLIAIPSYSKAKKKAMEKEAISNIKLMAAGERIYKMEEGSYAACANAAACNTALKLMLNITNWQYSVDASGEITATAQASTGMTCTYTLSSLDYDAAPSPSASCP